jgi:hypothetical protein
MHTQLLVLLDESDACSKDTALHFLALHLAHQQARCCGLTSTNDPQAYAEFVFPRATELEAKLRKLIAIGPP